MVNPYPVSLQAPDISPYREGNTGVEYLTTFDSGKPGAVAASCCDDPPRGQGVRSAP